MRAVIFANGQLNGPAKLQPEDLIIAADGGAQHCLKLGIRPQVVIGDFDSVSPDELETLRGQGAEIIAFPARKDYTDLELALLEAQKRGAKQILLLAALGARWDQSLANILLPAAFPGLRISLVDGPQEISFIHPGETLEITGRAGRYRLADPARRRRQGDYHTWAGISPGSRNTTPWQHTRHQQCLTPPGFCSGQGQRHIRRRPAAMRCDPPGGGLRLDRAGAVSAVCYKWSVFVS